MTKKEFEDGVTVADVPQFAELSVNWSPLHTDSAYAVDTGFLSGGTLP